MADAAPLLGTLQDTLAHAFMVVLKYVGNSTEAEFKMLAKLAGMFPGGHGAITMHAIAEATGLSRRSVQSASRGLALRKLIRIAPGQGPKPPTFHLDFLLAESTLANSAPLAESTLANSAPLAESTLANSAPLAESPNKERACAPVVTDCLTDLKVSQSDRLSEALRKRVADAVQQACGGQPIVKRWVLDSIVEHGMRVTQNEAVLRAWIHDFAFRKRAKRISVNPGLIELAAREDLRFWVDDGANKELIGDAHRTEDLEKQKRAAMREIEDPEEAEAQRRMVDQALENPERADEIFEDLRARRKARGQSA